MNKQKREREEMCQLWVTKELRSQLKSIAGKENKSIIELLEELIHSPNP